MGHCCFVSRGFRREFLRSQLDSVHQKDLYLCGLKLNREKSTSEPNRAVAGMQFIIPPMKITKLKSNLDFIISSRTVTFRDLAWVSRSHQLVICSSHGGLIAGLFTRQIHSTIQARSGWGCHFLILFLYRRSFVFGFFIFRPLTVIGTQGHFLRHSNPICYCKAYPCELNSQFSGNS